MAKINRKIRLSNNAYAEEVREGKCFLCGAEKECVRFVKDTTVLLIFPDRDVFQICESCLSRAFKLLCADY